MALRRLAGWGQLCRLLAIEGDATQAAAESSDAGVADGGVARGGQTSRKNSGGIPPGVPLSSMTTKKFPAGRERRQASY